MSDTTAAVLPHFKDDPRDNGGALVRVGVAFTSWAERWFPDAYIFVAVVAILFRWLPLPTGHRPLL